MSSPENVEVTEKVFRLDGEDPDTAVENIEADWRDGFVADLDEVEPELGVNLLGAYIKESTRLQQETRKKKRSQT